MMTLSHAVSVQDKPHQSSEHETINAQLPQYQAPTEVETTPPWWLSWWAYAVHLLIAGALMYLLLYTLAKRRRAENTVFLNTERLNTKLNTQLLNTQLELSQISRKLETVVAEKTHDLQKSHSKLQAQHQELKHMQSQLVQSEKMSSLGVLIAGIGHELNNPAHFTRGSAANLSTAITEFHQFLITLAGDNADPSVLEALSERIEVLTADLRIITDGTERIQEIVNNLCTFARHDNPTLQRTQIKKGLLSTKHLVETSYKNLIDIDCKIDDNPSILCSPGEINQVFMNLIVNACQAIADAESLIETGMTKGSPSKNYRLSIHMRIVGASLRINVCDNGPGIPAELLSKIFDPFFTTKKEGEGTGLGLSISYQIVQRHHGTIQVNSELGEGTDFQVDFPLLADTINF